MAYAAAISLKGLLRGVYHSSNESDNINYLTPFVSFINEIADLIQRFDFEENGVDGQYLEKEMTDALWRAQDIIEFYSLSQQEDINESSRVMSQTSNFSEDFNEVLEEIESIKERMDNFADNLKFDEQNFIAVDNLPPIHKNKMVGLDRSLELMKEIIFGETSQRLHLGAIVLHGMGGTGKTSLAISTYNDLDVRSRFSVGAWIQISLQHSVRNILLNLLHTIEFFHDEGLQDIVRTIVNRIIEEENDNEEIADFLQAMFRLPRYLVIVDCLCDIDLSSWDYIKSLLPDSNNGSRILLVSRGPLTSDREFVVCNYDMGFLDASQSWNLLQQQVFGEEPCPDTALERIGKKIAKNCQGLPLAIITVGVHLGKEEKTVEYWNKVADSGNSIAYAADGATMFAQLGLSYKQMPRHLRPIFLYMGAFPEGQEFSLLEHTNLLAAEVLIDYQGLPSELFQYFSERNLIFDIQLANNNNEMFTWSLHHALWHFCCNQARKEEFFHAFDKCTNAGEDSIINRKLRRLVVRKTVLFGITQFFDKIQHSELSIRSILFTGPYHPYPITKILWGSYKMLRVLNACSIRFYEFPAEILCLKLLRYLALTLNGGDLPPEISKLRNLISLIVRFHQIVRSCEGGPSYLPMEIWEMQQLAHLQVTGFDLPTPPPHSDALLPNLWTLMDVSSHSCTKEVLERIPNLRIIKISIHFTPKRNSAPVYLFDTAASFENVFSATFEIPNPFFEESTGSQMVALPGSFSCSMKNLTNLSLSGCGFPWENIEPISQLPFLIDLELRSHAFRGPKWELTSSGFSCLEHLFLEDLDLIYWTTGSGDHFLPCIVMVSISGCHKLKQIPLSFVHCRDLTAIGVTNSSHEAENLARDIEMKRHQTMGLIVASQRGLSVSMF